jgi:hypothetical protein
MTILKGLNLPPVEAIEVVNGLVTRLDQIGDTRYRGRVVIRSNKTTPPDGQELPGIGYRVVHNDDGVMLRKINGRKKYPILSGLVVGTATIVNAEREDTGWVWTFADAQPVERRCPAGCEERGEGYKIRNANNRWVNCPVCKGSGECEPVDIGTTIRRAWFQWDPLAKSRAKDSEWIKE